MGYLSEEVGSHLEESLYISQVGAKEESLVRKDEIEKKESLIENIWL